MNESPTKLRAELLAFLEEKDRRKLVPLIGTRVIDCGYQPPRVVGGEEDFVESLAEQEPQREVNAGVVLCACGLGLFWILATAAVVAIWS